MSINQLETNTEETIQEGDIVSFEFGDELAVDGIVVEGENGLEIQLDEEAEHYLTELVPLAIGAAGAAWTAYDAYQAKKAYDRGEITAQQLATRVGTDAALSLAGGAVAKGVGKLAKKAVGMFRKGKDTTADTVATAAGAQAGSTQSTRVANKVDNAIDRRKSRGTGGRLGRAGRRMAGGAGADRSMNGVDTDVFAKGFADDIERLRQLSGLTESVIAEGTWALPDTIEKAKEIASLMNNPIPVEKAADLMYSLIGDDELFDLFGELEDDGAGTDARPTIARWIADNMDLIAANVDDQEVIKALADIAELHESEQQIEEALSNIEFGMFTDSGDAQIENGINHILRKFTDDAIAGTEGNRDELRMEAHKELLTMLEEMSEEKEYEEAMDTDVRQRAAAHLEKGILRVYNMLDIGSKMKEAELDEAEYQGRKVELNKPTRGDVKKFKVYVKNDKGNVVKVNFGHKGKGNEKTMRIKKSDPKRRKSFRARHNCDNPGPKWKARYWSCRAW